MIKKEGNKIQGHMGTWFIIDQATRSGGEKLYLLESEQLPYGDEAAAIIVDINGNIILEDVRDGFDDLDFLYGTPEWRD